MLSKSESRAVYLRVGGIFLFGLLIIPLFVVFSPATDLLNTLVSQMTDVGSSHPILSVSIFLILTILAAVVSFVGIFPLAPSAIEIWGTTGTFFLLMLGWLIGDLFMYIIGRFAGGRKIRELKYFQKVDSLLESIPRTEFAVILLLRLALPTEIFGYALGVLKYRFERYLVITLLAEIPFAFLTVYGAESFLEGDFVGLSGAIIFAALIITLTFVIARKRGA